MTAEAPDVAGAGPGDRDVIPMWNPDAGIDMHSCTKWRRDGGNLYLCHRLSGHPGKCRPNLDAIIIEWPAPLPGGPPSALAGSRIVITDALSGKQIKTCSRLTVNADAAMLVTAELTLPVDEDGEPILDGTPVLRDGEILTATFPFTVSEMRVRQA